MEEFEKLYSCDECPKDENLEPATSHCIKCEYNLGNPNPGLRFYVQCSYEFENTDRDYKDFHNWWKSQQRRFHCSHSDDKDIAYSAYLEGLKQGSKKC